MFNRVIFGILVLSFVFNACADSCDYTKCGDLYGNHIYLGSIKAIENDSDYYISKTLVNECDCWLKAYGAGFGSYYLEMPKKLKPMIARYEKANPAISKSTIVHKDTVLTQTSVDTTSHRYILTRDSIYFANKVQRRHMMDSAFKYSDNCGTIQCYQDFMTNYPEFEQMDYVKNQITRLQNSPGGSNNLPQTQQDQFQQFKEFAKSGAPPPERDADEISEEICTLLESLKTIDMQLKKQDQIAAVSGVYDKSEKYKWGKRKVNVLNQIASDKQEFKKLTKKTWASKKCNQSDN